jgi:5-methylcytosine-specific restriction endonuclease McrA
MTFGRHGREWNPAKATIEHVLPICRGGFHVWANVALACAQCNARKQKKTLAEWMESGGPVSAELLDHVGEAAA